MHMTFLSRGFKNLQWYCMTVKNPVTMPVTGFSYPSKWGFDHDFDHKHAGADRPRRLSLLHQRRLEALNSATKLGVTDDKMYGG